MARITKGRARRTLHPVLERLLAGQTETLAYNLHARQHPALHLGGDAVRLSLQGSGKWGFPPRGRTPFFIFTHTLTPPSRMSDMWTGSGKKWKAPRSASLSGCSRPSRKSCLRSPNGILGCITSSSAPTPPFARPWKKCEIMSRVMVSFLPVPLTLGGWGDCRTQRVADQYLRSRANAAFDRDNFDSLSSKFVSKLVIRAN